VSAITNIQEEFSYAYIHAITAAAGYALEQKPRLVDNQGIDITIRGAGRRGINRAPVLDAQIKSTSIEILTGNQKSFPYDLDVIAYNDLRLEEYTAPMILIVVVVPKDRLKWIEQSEDKLCLRKCAYWLSLEGRAETSNKEQIRIPIPRSNLLTVDALREIMNRVKERKKL